MSATTDDRSVLYDSLLDWIVLALLALQGLGVAAAGGILATGVSRDVAREVAADVIADPDVQLSLSEAELADAVYTIITWGGIGLAVGGLLTVVAGGWLYRYRGRVRDRLDAGDPAPRWHAPVFGALFATALAFVPFVQVAGGAAAGAISTSSPTLDGAISGALFGAPLFVTVGAVVAGAFAAGTPVVAVITLLIVAFSVAFDAVLGALGGLAAGLLT
jgi:hypothetical protein